MVTKSDVKKFYTMEDRPLLVGIAGSAGVGKTTLSENLKALCPDLIEVMHLDDYILPKSSIRKLAFEYSDPRTVDYKTFIKHLYALSCGKQVRHNKKYSFVKNDVVRKNKILNPRPVIICEGWVLFHYKAMRDLFGARIYLDLPTAERVQRTIFRDRRVRGGVMTKERLRYLKNISPQLQEKWAKPQAQYATHKFYSTSSPGKLTRVVLSTLKLSVS